jgi:predicted ester cyclase
MEETMPLTPAEMDRLLDEHFDYEARDDVEGVLGTLAEDVVHDIIGWPPGPSSGRDAARPFYETLFKDIAGEEVTSVRRLYGENFLVDESLWKGKAPGAPFGFEGKGRPLEFRLLHLLEFSDAKEITREQVWIDFTAIRAQLAGD